MDRASLQYRGIAYYANLLTRQTRWLPPHRWMEGWVSRPTTAITPAAGVLPTSLPLCDLSDAMFGGDRGFDARALLPLHIARQRVEGGAPHLHERGVPQYPPDEYDSPLTYPLATVAAQHVSAAHAQSLPAPSSLTPSFTTPSSLTSSTSPPADADLATVIHAVLPV